LIREFWERRPQETAIAYERFRYYLSLAPETRSFNAVAKRFRVTLPTIAVIAKKHQWRERASSYDRRTGESTVAVATEATIAEALSQLNKVDEQGESPAGRALEEYRQEVERLGRQQMDLAKRLTKAAIDHSKNLEWSIERVTKHRQGEEEIEPRLLVGLHEAIEKTAKTLATLTTASTMAMGTGQEAWGRAIAVDRMLLEFRRLIEVEAQAQSEGVLPVDVRCEESASGG
jgi:hypothetical protein